MGYIYIYALSSTFIHPGVTCFFSGTQGGNKPGGELGLQRGMQTFGFLKCKLKSQLQYDIDHMITNPISVIREA